VNAFFGKKLVENAGVAAWRGLCVTLATAERGEMVVITLVITKETNA
jgi:hypothetical protein